MLTTCRDCGHSISRSAHACPECGRPTGRAPVKRGLFESTLIVIVSAFFIIFILPWMCCASPLLLLPFVPDDDKAYVSDRPIPPQPKSTQPHKRVAREPRPIPQPAIVTTPTPEPVVETVPPHPDSATLWPKPPPPEPPDPYAACHEWGKGDEFINAIFTKYLDARRTVTLRRRLKSARLSCSQRVSRVGDIEELEQCRDCLAEIVGQVYWKKAPPPSVAKRKSRRKGRADRNACVQWGKQKDYLDMLKNGYRAVRQASMSEPEEGMSESEVVSHTVDACIDRVSNDRDLALCQECVRALVREVYAE